MNRYPYPEPTFEDYDDPIIPSPILAAAAFVVVFFCAVALVFLFFSIVLSSVRDVVEWYANCTGIVLVGRRRAGGGGGRGRGDAAWPPPSPLEAPRWLQILYGDGIDTCPENETRESRDSRDSRESREKRENHDSLDGLDGLYHDVEAANEVQGLVLLPLGDDFPFAYAVDFFFYSLRALFCFFGLAERTF